MIRKITLALILFCILVSCGKKGDPEYKESTIKKNMQLLSINKEINIENTIFFIIYFFYN